MLYAHNFSKKGKISLKIRILWKICLINCWSVRFWPKKASPGRTLIQRVLSSWNNSSVSQEIHHSLANIIEITTDTFYTFLFHSNHANWIGLPTADNWRIDRNFDDLFTSKIVTMRYIYVSYIELTNITHFWSDIVQLTPFCAFR